jgi:hypothetical protein
MLCTSSATEFHQDKHLGYIELHSLLSLHIFAGVYSQELFFLMLSQRSYLESIIQHYGFDGLKPLSIVLPRLGKPLKRRLNVM